jgi:predicted dehydrogenase
VAFADVDKTRWGGVLEKEDWSEAKGYTDWRKIFENHAKELDVIFVAAPDHNHFAPQ